MFTFSLMLSAGTLARDIIDIVIQHFPSGITVEECGELEMIWMPETGVNVVKSRDTDIGRSNMVR